MSVQLRVIGSSPAWPNPGGAHSGYLLEAGGRQLLLDCGPGVLARLRADEAWPHLEAIAITHFHLDHWGDLVPWVWGSFYISTNGPIPRPELWVHPGGRDFLAGLGDRLGFPTMFEEAFELHEYPPGQSFTAAGEFEVRAIRVPHYQIETYAFRVEAEGVVVAYSGDSAPSERLAELARDADLFVCEATLERPQLDGHPRGHLTLDEAVAAFRSSHARRLLVTHRPAELPVDAELELAYDGMELVV